jgi:glycerate-2-kinase
MPDERGLAATARLYEHVGAINQPVIALISGGASALLVQPAAPVTLAEKIAINGLLLRRGASIAEVNTVRKHLSVVKGGGVLRHCVARPLRTLILSDVVGDDPSVIGSGPTVPDPTTFADALDVLRRYDLDQAVAPSVRHRLDLGARGKIEETVKPGATVEDGSKWSLLGSNRTALSAGAEQATRLGYHAVVMSEPLLGDTTVSARAWLHRVRQLVDPATSPWCVVAGGETTVDVKGAGRGGRNQEFALALVEPLAGSALNILSAGTDGIDGPTDAAGAFVDGGTHARARLAGIDSIAALERSDSYSFFAALRDLFAPGPTGTNVSDIKIAIGGGP